MSSSRLTWKSNIYSFDSLKKLHLFLQFHNTKITKFYVNDTKLKQLQKQYTAISRHFF